MFFVFQPKVTISASSDPGQSKLEIATDKKTNVETELTIKSATEANNVETQLLKEDNKTVISSFALSSMRHISLTSLGAFHFFL